MSGCARRVCGSASSRPSRREPRVRRRRGASRSAQSARCAGTRPSCRWDGHRPSQWTAISAHTPSRRRPNRSDRYALKATPFSWLGISSTPAQAIARPSARAAVVGPVTRKRLPGQRPPSVLPAARPSYAWPAVISSAMSDPSTGFAVSAETNLNSPRNTTELRREQNSQAPSEGFKRQSRRAWHHVVDEPRVGVGQARLERDLWLPAQGQQTR